MAKWGDPWDRFQMLSNSVFSFAMLDVSCLLSECIPKEFLFVCLFGLCFQTGSHAPQAGTELTVWWKMTLNFWCSCLFFPHAGITGVSTHSKLQTVLPYRGKDVRLTTQVGNRSLLQRLKVAQDILAQDLQHFSFHNCESASPPRRVFNIALAFLWEFQFQEKKLWWFH